MYLESISFYFFQGHKKVLMRLWQDTAGPWLQFDSHHLAQNPSHSDHPVWPSSPHIPCRGLDLWCSRIRRGADNQQLAHFWVVVWNFQNRLHHFTTLAPLPQNDFSSIKGHLGIDGEGCQPFSRLFLPFTLALKIACFFAAAKTEASL